MRRISPGTRRRVAVSHLVHAGEVAGRGGRTEIGFKSRCRLNLQKIVRIDGSLAKDRAKGALGHIAWMIRYGGKQARRGIAPDLVRPARLTDEREAAAFQSSDNLAIAEPREAPHQALTING